MGVVAVNVGDLDLAHGLDFLRQEASQGLPLISANLLDAAKKSPIFPPFVIKDVSGIRVAFLGLTHPDLRPIAQKVVADSIVVKDPIEAARETMEKLRGKADYVVLLSDLGVSKEQDVAKAVPGIHFVLGGHDGRYVSSPHQEGKTPIVQSYYKGMYVGRLRLTLENPPSSFQDEGAQERLQQQVTNVDVQLSRLQKAAERQSTPQLQQSIQQLVQQKAQLEDQLKQLSSSPPKGNRFHWSLQSLDPTLPENEDVRGWVREAGIDRD